MRELSARLRESAYIEQEAPIVLHVRFPERHLTAHALCKLIQGLIAGVHSHNVVAWLQHGSECHGNQLLGCSNQDLHCTDGLIELADLLS